MKIVAHRGYSAKYPENTLPAFDAALRNPDCGTKISGIELDIQLSADNKIVVFHDVEIESNGQRKPVSSFTYEQIINLTLPRLNGERVPLLDEVLNLVDHRLELLVEIKAGQYQHSMLLQAVLEQIKSYQPQGSDIIIHSFSADIMCDALTQFSGVNVKYGALCGTAVEIEKFADIIDRLDYIHPSFNALLDSPGAFEQTNRPFHLWTVNSKEQFDKIMRLPCRDKIRAVMTDELELFCQIV
jgi:glycerophosphoryl diester phosphodiesterase